VIKSWSFDLDAEYAELEYDDRCARFDLPFPLSTPDRTGIRHLRMDFANGVLQLRLPNGTLAPIELAIPGYDNETLLRQRFVVYLDQNLWSRLARARHGLGRVADTECKAAVALARLAEQQHIILPMSGSHFAETGRHRGPNRIPIASTILELSRGWQMSHPGRIGLNELTAALEGRAPPKHDAMFTLAPYATFLQSPAIPQAPFGEPLRSLLPQAIAATTTYSLLVGDEPFPDDGVREALERWAAAMDDLVRQLANDRISRDAFRRTALGRLLVDNGEVALLQQIDGVNREAFAPSSLAAWLPQAERDVAAMPYLARLWHVDFARLRNGSRFKRSDLADILNLSAAAGYATVVAGERRTIGDLRTAEGVPPGAQLATSLEEAVRGVLTAMLRRAVSIAATVAAVPHRSN
jgi:hypothetical protein